MRARERTSSSALSRNSASVIAPRSPLVRSRTATLAVLIAAAVADDFGAGAAWTLVTVLGAAYILSRGLAKYERPAEDHLD